MLRAQLVIAVVFGFTILAVVLYLMRRPNGTEHAVSDGSGEPSASAAPPVPAIVRTAVSEPKKEPERLKVGGVSRVRCGSSAKATPNEGSLCDSVPFFEQAFSKAVTDSVDCAPKEKDGGSINFVLAVDFRNHDFRVYPGRSGTWHGKKAKKAAECVHRALPAPTWESVAHQYRYYLFAVLATYPARAGLESTPDFK